MAYRKRKSYGSKKRRYPAKTRSRQSSGRTRQQTLKIVVEQVAPSPIMQNVPMVPAVPAKQRKL